MSDVDAISQALTLYYFSYVQGLRQIIRVILLAQVGRVILH